jgi:hypothetical protein
MDSAEDRTSPDERTQATEEDEAGQAHRADRAPTSAEEAAADRHLEETDEKERQSVAEHYEEMSEIGADAKGEGRIE